MSTSEVQAPQPGNGSEFRVGGRTLARNTVLNLFGRVVPLLVGIVTMPYVIRHLGPDRFGLLSLAWIVVAYFALFNLGIGPATTKFVAELLGEGGGEKLPDLVWTAVISQTCLGVVGGVLLFVATPLLVNRLLKIPPDLHGQAHLIFLILAFALPVDFANGSMSGVLGASQRFDLLNAVAVPSSAFTYLLPVVALALGFGLPAIVLFLVLARVAGFAVVTLLCLRLYPGLRGGLCFNARLVWKLLNFGGWVTVSGVVSPILDYFDKFLVGSVLSIGAVGFYTPPYMIASKLWIFPGSLMATLFPAFSASAGRDDSQWIRNALVRSLKYLLLTVGPAALALGFFARPLLTLWVGPRFANEGALVLQIFAVGVLSNSLAQVPYVLLQGIGRPDLTAKFHLAELPIHVGLAWFLVTMFGLPGAALAWTIRVSLDFVLLIVAACWLTRTPASFLVSREVRRSVGALMALAIGLGALWASTRSFLPDTAFSFLLGAGFLLAAWHYVLDGEEKCQIRLWLGAAR